MTVISAQKDAATLSMTIVARFDASPARVWELWSDPRKLELWWCPPGYPATFEEHDLRPGGRSVYWVDLDDGTRQYAWWHVGEVDEPRRLTFSDGFGDENGTPTGDAKPADGVVTFDDADGGTRMTAVVTFPDLATMERMVEMGMFDGLQLAMGQMDDVLTGTLTR